MKIAHVGFSDGMGGADRASYRLHSALLSAGCDSRMYVARKISDDQSVTGPDGRYAKFSSMARDCLAQAICKASIVNDGSLRSLGLTGSGLLGMAEKDGCDLINLHWIGGESVGLNELRRAKKPLVWRVPDMWPFCGAEHYSDVGPAARWRLGYDVTTPGVPVRFDIDRFVWLRKSKHIPKNIHFVATTSFVASCLNQSALFNNSNVTVIPNTLDTQKYRPWPKRVAREILGLPVDAKLVAFGALGGGKDPRKGADLLKAAFIHLAQQKDCVEGVIFGQSRPVDAMSFSLPIHWMGRLYDDATLALLYSSADVMVVPSRQETFGQTASEAQACGTPVVAFNVTGLPDVVAHKITGYLAEPYSSEDLAKGIQWVLGDADRYKNLSNAARERALRLWSPEVVVPQYLSLYRSVTGQI